MDLKAYALGEGDAAERARVEAELSKSVEAQDELQRLELTLASLRSIPDEEIPRRIAFVSDPVFEPSWWQRFWQSGPQLGFLSAGMLACAILMHAWIARPVTNSMPTVQAGLPAAEVRQMIDTAVFQAVGVAVRKAQAEAEAKQKETVQAALLDSEKKHQLERQMMTASFDENLSLLRKQMNRMYVSTAGLSVGEVQQ